MLKSHYESADEVPENLKECYTETNGKFHFVGVEGWKSPEDFDKVNKALGAERKLRKTAEESASPWAVFSGKTPAEIQAELERIPLLEESSKDKVDKSRIEQMIDSAAKNRLAPVERERDGYKTQVGELQATIAKYEANNRTRTIFDAVRGEAAKDQTLIETTYASERGALMLLAAQYLTIEEGTGKVIVRDEADNLTPGMGVKDFLAELKREHSYLAKPSVGGGATGSNGAGGNGPNVFKQNDMSVRVKWMKENEAHPDRIEKAMRAAGLKGEFDQFKGSN